MPLVDGYPRIDSAVASPQEALAYYEEVVPYRTVVWFSGPPPSINTGSDQEAEGQIMLTWLIANAPQPLATWLTQNSDVKISKAKQSVLLQTAEPALAWWYSNNRLGVLYPG